MIKTEKIAIKGKVFTRTYSDAGFYIEREGIAYIEAIDPSELKREYDETVTPILSYEQQTVAAPFIFNNI